MVVTKLFKTNLEVCALILHRIKSLATCLTVSCESVITLICLYSCESVVTKVTISYVIKISEDSEYLLNVSYLVTCATLNEKLIGVKF